MAADVLEQWLETHDGVVTCAEARGLGIGPSELRTAVRTGTIEPVCRGAYAAAHLVQGDDPERRHRVRRTAVLRARPGQLIATHTSAALAWGLPVSYAHLDQVHVARNPGRGTTRKYRHHTLHEGYPAVAATTVDGTPTVVAAVAVLGTAFLYGVIAGVTVADAALRAHITTMVEIDHWVEKLARTPGMAAARSALRQASPSAESPGESWLRVILTGFGFAVVPQFTIRDADGRFVARVDFLLPELGVIVEFDGAVKYEGNGGGPDAPFAEKRREDDIRRCGYAVVRVIWSDLTRPQKIRDWIHAATETHPAARPA